MEIPKLKICLIDSLNFLQMPLKAFSKTFGLNELKKGYFPVILIKNITKIMLDLSQVRNIMGTIK